MPDRESDAHEIRQILALAGVRATVATPHDGAPIRVVVPGWRARTRRIRQEKTCEVLSDGTATAWATFPDQGVILGWPPRTTIAVTA